MKYLLTESQINKFVDRIIQETIQELRDECEDYDEATEPGEWYNWDDCDAVYWLEKLVINNIENDGINKSTVTGKVHHRFIVWVNVYYHSLGRLQYDWDSMADLLKFRIFQKYKIVLQIRIEGETNTKTNVQW
jgi:hypothetical protein